jgi:hypothetical protein
MLVDGKQRVLSRFQPLEGKLVWFGRIDGRPVCASNGVECAVNTSLEEERRKMAGENAAHGETGRTCKICGCLFQRLSRSSSQRCDSRT